LQFCDSPKGHEVPVDKLFWEDPYLTACDAIVTSADGDCVTLDRSVAFAFSGGQASDEGTIAGHRIVLAETRGLEIVYTLPAAHGLGCGDSVRVVIDPDVRSRLRRLHFAAELVLEVVTRDFGAPEKAGANISAGKARIDFAWDGTIADVLPHIAAKVEAIVAEDLPIISAFDDAATQRRYWEIVGFARVACGGTHPRRTGEVGAVTLKRANPGAGRERIEISLADN
jgi:Ser-tRNA(Ala) deacylase AlaX